MSDEIQNADVPADSAIWELVSVDADHTHDENGACIDSIGLALYRHDTKEKFSVIVAKTESQAPLSDLQLISTLRGTLAFVLSGTGRETLPGTYVKKKGDIIPHPIVPTPGSDDEGTPRLN